MVYLSPSLCFCICVFIFKVGYLYITYSSLVFYSLYQFVFWQVYFRPFTFKVIIDIIGLIPPTFVLFSFFFFWYSHYVYITHFLIIPQSLDVLFYFITLMSSLQINSPKAVFISVAVFFIFNISVWFFLRSFISLLTLLICSYMLKSRALNVQFF